MASQIPIEENPRERFLSNESISGTCDVDMGNSIIEDSGSEAPTIATPPRSHPADDIQTDRPLDREALVYTTYLSNLMGGNWYNENPEEQSLPDASIPATEHPSSESPIQPDLINGNPAGTWSEHEQGTSWDAMEQHAIKLSRLGDVIQQSGEYMVEELQKLEELIRATEAEALGNGNIPSTAVFVKLEQIWTEMQNAAQLGYTLLMAGNQLAARAEELQRCCSNGLDRLGLTGTEMSDEEHRNAL